MAAPPIALLPTPSCSVLKLLLTATISSVLVTACATDSSYPEGSAPLPDSASSGLASPTATAASPTASEFTFPQANCSDRTTSDSTTWYPVIIKGADLERIRSNYCGDAISTIQAISGTPAVQVATFTNYDKAVRFAKTVGGEVEGRPIDRIAQSSPSPTNPNSTTSPTNPNSTSSPTNLSPTPNAASSSPSPVEGNKSAMLATREAGSPINIRTSASTSAPVQDVGYSGDAIQIQSSTQGEDGYVWYNVRSASGITGWVRGDLISNSPAANQSTTNAEQSTPEPLSPSPALTTNQPSPNPGTSDRSTVLTASESGSSINVREAASTEAQVQSTAYAGDPIRVVGQTQGTDGYVWYNVQFNSGTTGWVRGDFVKN